MANEIPLTKAQVAVLADKAPGWEEVFARLSNALRPRWTRFLRHKFRNVPEDIREDAVQDLLARYWKNAQAGTLLAGYSGEVPVEDYLSSSRVLSGAVLDLRRNERPMKSFDEKGQGKPGVSADACGDSDDASNTDADEDFQADEGETKDAPAGTILIHLTAAPDKLTSPWVAAVAHLYQTIDGQAPQANWGADPHPRLWAQTRTQLLAAPQGADACVMAMNTAHAEAQSALGEECDRVIAERIAHRECEIHLRQGEAATPQDRLWLVSQERHRRESACDDHLMWIELRKKFHPLGTSQLTALFGWSSAAAQQYCKRYRSAWPQILPGFGEKVQALYGTQGAVPKNQSKETR